MDCVRQDIRDIDNRGEWKKMTYYAAKLGGR